MSQLIGLPKSIDFGPVLHVVSLFIRGGKLSWELGYEVSLRHAALGRRGSRMLGGFSGKRGNWQPSFETKIGFYILVLARQSCALFASGGIVHALELVIYLQDAGA